MKRIQTTSKPIPKVPLKKKARFNGFYLLLIFLLAAVAAAVFFGPKLRERQQELSRREDGAVFLVTAQRLLEADRLGEAEKALESAARRLPDDARVPALREKIQMAWKLREDSMAPAIQERMAAAKELALDDLMGALSALRQIIETPDIPAKLAKEAAELEESLSKATCSLRFPEGWPLDAKVQIDGRFLIPDEGIIADITPGSRPIGFQRPGFRDPPAIPMDFRGTRPVDLPEVIWRPLPGRLQLTSEPAGAAVWRDGQDTGLTTPCTLEDVDSGKVEVILKLPGHLDAVVTGELQPETTLELAGQLVMPPSLPREGANAGERAEFNLTPALRIAFRWCPAGTFRMGAGENARDVTLSHGFWIGETEVTQAMWEQLSGQPFATFMAISKKEHPEESIGPDHPAFSISWEKLRGSTARPVGLFQSLNTYLSEASSSWKVDLPTEAQWEYACRAGGGEAPPKIDQIAWFRGNSKGTCHPVGTKDANPWGIHDMQGNLHEWCFDWFQESYEGLPTTDPVGPASGWKRVMRGGGYHSPAQSCSATSRASAYEMTAHPLIGFRLVLKPGDAPP